MILFLRRVVIGWLFGGGCGAGIDTGEVVMVSGMVGRMGCCGSCVVSG